MATVMQENQMSLASDLTKYMLKGSLSIFDSLELQERGELKEMLCEFLDTTDADERREVAISIMELFLPARYFSVDDSRDVGEWIDSESDDMSAAAALAKKKEMFASNVLRAMAQAGIDQSALAGRIGVSQPTASAMMSGKHKPQPKTLKKLAEALNVDVDELWPAQ